MIPRDWFSDFVTNISFIQLKVLVFQKKKQKQKEASGI